MFVTNQRNFTLNINNLNIEQQRFIITKNNKVKINKLNEYYKKRNNFSN